MPSGGNWSAKRMLKEREREQLERIRMQMEEDKVAGRFSDENLKRFAPAEEKVDLPADEAEKIRLDIVKKIAKYGAVVLQESGRASVFFIDGALRDQVCEQMKSINCLAKSNRIINHKRDFDKAERSIYEILVDRNFADQLLEDNKFPTIRIANWGLNVGINEKVIEALRIFRRTEPHFDRTQPEESRYFEEPTQTSTGPLLDKDAVASAVFSHGVVALIEGSKGSVFFKDKALRDQVFESIKATEPNSLAQNRFGEIENPRKYYRGNSPLYEIKLTHSYVMGLVNHPECKYERIAKRGFNINNEDKVTEAFEQFSKLENEIVCAPYDYVSPTFVPVQNQDISPNSQGNATNEAVINEALTTDSNISTLPAAIDTAAASAIIVQEPEKIVTEEDTVPKSIPIVGNEWESHIKANTTNQSERPMEATADIPAKNTHAGYTEYLASFGFMLKDHREARNMSREQLACIASQSLAETETVTAENVKHWEQSRGELPTTNQFDALARILIDNNPKIANKDKARSDFNIAYIKSLSAKKAPSDENEDDLYLFANKLSELRETILDGSVVLSRDKLAAQVSDSLKVALPADELNLLTEHKGKFIAGIEAGLIKPSKNLVLTLVKGLDASRELAAEQKQQLFDAYAAMPSKTIELSPKTIVVGNGRPRIISGNHRNSSGIDKNDNNPNGTTPDAGGVLEPAKRRRVRLSDEEPDDPILKLKFKIRKIVNKDNNPTKEVSEAIGINYTTLSILFSGASNPASTGGFSTNSHRKIVEHIRRIYPNGIDEKVTEFEQLYSQLRDSCARGASVAR